MSSIVEELPIEADDSINGDNRERLPKQFPRRLFPAQPHEKIYNFISGTLADWKKMTEYKEPSSPNWPLHNPELLARHSSAWLPSETLSPKSALLEHEEGITGRESSQQRARLTRAASYTDCSQRSEYNLPKASTEKGGRYGRDLSPPPIGAHRRRRSHRESHSHRDIPTKTVSTLPLSQFDPVYHPNTDYANAIIRSSRESCGTTSRDRRTREEEYRHMQGRGPRSSFESSRGSSR